MSLKKLQKITTQTEYQVFCSLPTNVIDFTAKRLFLYSKTVGSFESKKVLLLLDDYLAKKVAISWREGKPLFLCIKLN